MDHVLVDGDLALFVPSFGAALVIVRPGTLTGSGPATLNRKKLCVAGDEKSVLVSGCLYTAGAFSIPGVGTLTIAALSPDQQAVKSRTGRAALLLVGGRFTAKLTVVSPAYQPSAPSPVPDPTPHYLGKGSFVTANRKLRGT